MLQADSLHCILNFNNNLQHNFRLFLLTNTSRSLNEIIFSEGCYLVKINELISEVSFTYVTFSMDIS